MDSLAQDLRRAARALRRAPAFTLAAVLTLALGIGANAAIFSVVDGVLLRPAPFADLDRLMMVWETDRASGTSREPASIPDFIDFASRARQFQALSAFAPAEVNQTRPGVDPSRLAALAVTEQFIPMLGIRPIAGRSLSVDETREGGPRGVLISEALWESQFQRAPSAIGAELRLDDVAWTIVGVLPRAADFGTVQLLRQAAYGRAFADRGGATRIDLWYGLRPSADASRDNHPIFVAGRLARGASREAAQQELAGIAADLERAYPANAGRGVHVESMESVVFGRVRPAMLVLLGAVALVLLVSCVNVANLLLVRATAKSRDLSVRIALGAGTRELARQSLAESLILVVVGGTLGVLLAYGGLDLLLAFAPSSLPRIDAVSLDPRVLGVTLGCCVVVTLVFAALPLLQSRRRDLQAALAAGSTRDSGSRAHARLRSSLVVAELAMAVMLMTGAGLLLRTLWRLDQVDPGFATAGILKAEFQLPPSRYPQDRGQFPDWPAHQRFYSELIARVRATPGVVGIAIAAANPLDAGFTSSIRVVGREPDAGDWPEPAIRSVSPSYFETMRVPVADGRGFAEADRATAAPVIILNEAAVVRYFGARPALGQRIALWGAERTVVGIVGNERIRGLVEAAPPSVYLPLAQVPIGNAVLVRTSGAPDAFAPTLRGIVRELDPSLPLYGVEPLAATLSGSLAERRFTMLVLGAFAVVALLLAAVGVHGVLAYTVAQRTREIGIRMALGADAGSVRRLIVSQGARLTLGGVLIGVAGSLVLARGLGALLFGVSPTDPVTLLGVVLVLATAALLASWLPARRASRMDPLAALRAE